MDVELDLETGDPDAAERIAAAGAERSRARRANRQRDTDSGSKGDGDKTAKRSGGGSRTDSGLAGNLGEAFGRLADQLESSGDQELADAIRKDAKAMSQGIMALTRVAVFLRTPVLFLVNAAVVILAFWHVGGILARRFADRRARVMAERNTPSEYQADA